MEETVNWKKSKHLHLRQRGNFPNSLPLKSKNAADSASQTKVLKGKRTTQDPLPKAKEVLTTEL